MAEEYADFDVSYDSPTDGDWSYGDINPIYDEQATQYDFDVPQQNYNIPGYSVGGDGTQFWQGDDGKFVGYQELGGQFTPYDYSGPSFMDQFSSGVGSLGNNLSKIFPALTQTSTGSQRSIEQSIAPWLKMLGLGGAALMERKGQQSMAQSAPQAVNQIAQRADPFSDQRARYMQELSNSQNTLNQFRQNPNGNAQYAALRDAALERINRLGAKQGQRFAPQANNPAVVEALTNAQLGIEKQMMADRAGLYQPAGANVNPWAGGLEALLAGNKYGAQADTYSSLFNALGYGTQTNQNSAAQQETLAKLAEFLDKQGV